MHVMSTLLTYSSRNMLAAEGLFCNTAEGKIASIWLLLDWGSPNLVCQTLQLQQLHSGEGLCWSPLNRFADY